MTRGVVGGLGTGHNGCGRPLIARPQSKHCTERESTNDPFVVWGVDTIVSCELLEPGEAVSFYSKPGVMTVCDL